VWRDNNSPPRWGCRRVLSCGVVRPIVRSLSAKQKEKARRRARLGPIRVSPRVSFSNALVSSIGPARFKDCKNARKRAPKKPARVSISATRNVAPPNACVWPQAERRHSAPTRAATFLFRQKTKRPRAAELANPRRPVRGRTCSHVAANRRDPMCVANTLPSQPEPNVALDVRFRPQKRFSNV
jgi:hypothetical protein